jgi:hypothetical protein
MHLPAFWCDGESPFCIVEFGDEFWNLNEALNKACSGKGRRGEAEGAGQQYLWHARGRATKSRREVWELPSADAATALGAGRPGRRAQPARVGAAALGRLPRRRAGGTACTSWAHGEDDDTTARLRARAERGLRVRGIDLAFLGPNVISASFYLSDHGHHGPTYPRLSSRIVRRRDRATTPTILH